MRPIDSGWLMGVPVSGFHIKQMQRLLLMSDNSEYEYNEFLKESPIGLAVIGRVRWIEKMFKYPNKNLNNKKEWKSKDKNLFQSNFFRVMVITPLFLALVCTVLIEWHARSAPCSTAACFHNFLTLFKFPLGLASLAIPLGALAASYHRSIQTSYQISLQRAQNNFSSYFYHLEKFEQFYHSKYGQQAGIDAENLRYIHDKLFPNARSGNYEIALIATKTVEDIHDLMVKINDTVRYQIVTEKKYNLIDEDCRLLTKNLIFIGFKIEENHSVYKKILYSAIAGSLCNFFIIPPNELARNLVDLAIDTNNEIQDNHSQKNSLESLISRLAQKVYLEQLQGEMKALTLDNVVDHEFEEVLINKKLLKLAKKDLRDEIIDLKNKLEAMGIKSTKLDSILEV